MDLMNMAQMLFAASQNDPRALGRFDLSGIPPPDDPAFGDMMNPQMGNAGLALMGENQHGDANLMSGTNFAMPPGMTPTGEPPPIDPPGGPEPPPMGGPPPGGPPPQGNQLLRGIGRGLMGAGDKKPIMTAGVSGTPKGLADTTHKAGPQGPSPAQQLLAMLMGGRGGGAGGQRRA